MRERTSYHKIYRKIYLAERFVLFRSVLYHLAVISINPNFLGVDCAWYHRGELRYNLHAVHEKTLSKVMAAGVGTKEERTYQLFPRRGRRHISFVQKLCFKLAAD